MKWTEPSAKEALTPPGCRLDGVVAHPVAELGRTKCPIADPGSERYLVAKSRYCTRLRFQAGR